MPATIESRPLPGEEPWVPDVRAGETLWPARLPEPGAALWSNWTGKHRPCTTCIQLLIEDDRAVREGQPSPFGRRPPHPLPGTRRREATEDTWHCGPHGTELQRRDNEAKARAKVQREHAEHLARGNR